MKENNDKQTLINKDTTQNRNTPKRKRNDGKQRPKEAQHETENRATYQRANIKQILCL